MISITIFLHRKYINNASFRLIGNNNLAIYRFPNNHLIVQEWFQFFSITRINDELSIVILENYVSVIGIPKV